jgi:hypothetical protein
MLSENDKQTLIRNLSRNRVILVTGSGFSTEAISLCGNKLPVGSQLSKALWTYLYDSEYDGQTSLKTLYEAALHHRKGRAALRDFLRSQLAVDHYPEWYRLVPKWYWRRIYTFNADDLLEKVYRDTTTVGLERIVAPAHYSERDGFLRKVQYIKLHGSIDEDRDLTFGIREYGIRSAGPADVWYQHFVEDYSTLPTLFVGTELDEQLFWQYIELRGAQGDRGPKVRRPKCLLVSPTVSKPNEEVLARYNIIPVRTTAKEFFQWLDSNADTLSRENVLRLVDPTLEPALLAAEHGASTADVTTIEYFYSVFRAPIRPVNSRTRATFLLGIPPTWDDIASDVDAPREVNEVLRGLLIKAIEQESFDVISVYSAAGGVKSTICKRVALDLVDEGHTVYFSDGEIRPDPDRLYLYLRTLEHRSFLFFDNAGHDFALIAELWDRVKDLPTRPVLVLATRSNDLAFRGYQLARIGRSYDEFAIPNLTAADIESILAKLDQHDLLGELKGRTHQQQVEIFRDKARKQILVAMREATSGRGFDDIIRDEFAHVEPREARVLYLVASLASDAEYGLSVQQMITSMDLPPSQTQVLIEKSLAGILIQQEYDPSKYQIRHPAIAHFVLEAAPREVLTEAVIALLRTLSAVLPQGRDRRWSRAFRAYRDIINHRRLHTMFSNRPDLVRNIYEAIKPFYRDDGHYWLQYGSYEIEYGDNIDVAENYIGQADALLPHNRQVQTATAHLLMKKAATAQTAAAAKPLMEEAVALLRLQMMDPRVSLHPLHIFGSQMITYIRRWVPLNLRSESFRDVHDELRRSIPDHLRTHPELARLIEDLKRSELETVIRP